MKKNKLLFVINVDWYFRLHWLDRAIAAHNENFEIHVLTKITNEAFRQEFEKLGFYVYNLELRRKGVNLLQEAATFWAIFKLIKKLHPDIMHSITIKPNLYTGLAGRLIGHPVIASITGLGSAFSSNKTKLTRFIQHILIVAFQVAFGHPATRVLFENQEDMDKLTNSAITPSKASLLPGAGVDICAFNCLPLPSSPPLKILFAARLLQNKGLYELIQATSRLRNRGYAITLIVAGIVDTDARDTISLNDIDNWRESGLIDWRGQITDMHTLINECHIVCLPTRYGEGIPRILIEGSACGRALVGSNTPGCREIIKNNINGFLVDMESPHNLDSCIATLAENRNLLNQMGREGRKIAEMYFASNIVIQKTLEIYKQQTCRYNSKASH